jgi:Arc/MetJ-type ribon-helix-helix transcriptional regulator
LNCSFSNLKFELFLLIIAYSLPSIKTCSNGEQELSNRTNWNIPVPKTLDDALEEAVRLDTHSTKSDFVRDAVRRRLEEMGFTYLLAQKSYNSITEEAFSSGKT